MGFRAWGTPQMAPGGSGAWGKEERWSGGESSFLGSEFDLGKAKCRGWQDPQGA